MKEAQEAYSMVVKQLNNKRNVFGNNVRHWLAVTKPIKSKYVPEGKEFKFLEGSLYGKFHWEEERLVYWIPQGKKKYLDVRFSKTIDKRDRNEPKSILVHNIYQCTKSFVASNKHYSLDSSDWQESLERAKHQAEFEDFVDLVGASDKVAVVKSYFKALEPMKILVSELPQWLQNDYLKLVDLNKRKVLSELGIKYLEQEYRKERQTVNMSENLKFQLAEIYDIDWTLVKPEEYKEALEMSGNYPQYMAQAIFEIKREAQLI